MAQIGKFDYQVSQSVTSSFQQGDTVEFTFQAKGTSGFANSTEQKVNLFCRVGQKYSPKKLS